MSNLNDIPSWLGAGLFSILTFALGFFSKQIIVHRQKRAETEEKHLQRLVDLGTLLTESGDIFRVQSAQVRRLMNMVLPRVPEDVQRQEYDAIFHYMYDKYTEDERSLHELIRNLTMGHLYYVNKKLKDWLDGGYSFLSAPGVPGDFTRNDELRKKLDMLRRHLTLWLAQYDRDMVNHTDPSHALVYANDERGRGISFPTGIEQVVNEVIADWRRRVSS